MRICEKSSEHVEPGDQHHGILSNILLDLPPFGSSSASTRSCSESHPSSSDISHAFLATPRRGIKSSFAPQSPPVTCDFDDFRSAKFPHQPIETPFCQICSTLPSLLPVDFLPYHHRAASPTPNQYRIGNQNQEFKSTHLLLLRDPLLKQPIQRLMDHPHRQTLDDIPHLLVYRRALLSSLGRVIRGEAVHGQDGE